MVPECRRSSAVLPSQLGDFVEQLGHGCSGEIPAGKGRCGGALGFICVLVTLPTEQSGQRAPVRINLGSSDPLPMSWCRQNPNPKESSFRERVCPCEAESLHGELNSS